MCYRGGFISLASMIGSGQFNNACVHCRETEAEASTRGLEDSWRTMIQSHGSWPSCCGRNRTMCSPQPRWRSRYQVVGFFFFNFLISGPPPEVVTHSRRGTLPQLTFSRSTIKDPDEYLSADFISNEVGNHYKLLQCSYKHVTNICVESHVVDSPTVGTGFGIHSEAQPENW